MTKVYGNLNHSQESNIDPIKKHEFKIKDSSKIIKIFRDGLYKHKERTLVQEYICNARDAVREKYKLDLIKKDPSLDYKTYKGNDRAIIERKLRKEIDKKIKSEDIKVTIPSEMNPFFKVRDYGVGLSPERVENVFTYYCESTKGDSDIETGGFGIGAKSAWAYTDHFTVVSFYEGKKYTYTSHTEKEQGELALDDVSDTTEPNGVEIIVGVNPKDITIFQNYILRVCYFWKTRPQITGLHEADFPDWFDQKPDYSLNQWSFFYTDWATSVIKNRIFNDDPTSFIFILDGVPYSEAVPEYLSTQMAHFMEHHRSKGDLIIAYEAELGSVDVVASREHLAKTPKTLEILSKLTPKEEIKDHYKKEALTTKTLPERVTLVSKFHKILGYKFLASLFTETPTKYAADNISYSFESDTSVILNLSVNSKLYNILRVSIRDDINDKPVVSLSTLYESGNISLFEDESLPILIQDEELSVTNRRLKFISFREETKCDIFLVIEPLDLTKPALAKEAQSMTSATFISEYELTQTNRKETKRAAGVYTLNKIEFYYGRYSRKKIQQPTTFFDTVTSPFLLISEEEFKSLSDEQKSLAKDLQHLDIHLHIAAPSTITKLTGKKNIFKFIGFEKQIPKLITLPISATDYLFRHYFYNFNDLLTKDFNIFFTASMDTSSLIKEIKDPKLNQLLKDSDAFYIEAQRRFKSNNKVSIKFLETYFAAQAQAIKNLPYNKIHQELLSKKTEYPLLCVLKDPKLAKELVVYLNAKYKGNKT